MATKNFRRDLDSDPETAPHDPCPACVTADGTTRAIDPDVDNIVNAVEDHDLYHTGHHRLCTCDLTEVP